MAGYLDYRGCDLSGTALDTYELWSTHQYRKDDISAGIRTKMAAMGSFLTATRSPEIGEQVLDLLNASLESIIGASQDRSQSQDSDRYKQVFGEVSSEDVNRLNSFLENRAAMTKQTSESREAAMIKLQDDLTRKFRERISS